MNAFIVPGQFGCNTTEITIEKNFHKEGNNCIYALVKKFQEMPPVVVKLTYFFIMTIFLKSIVKYLWQLCCYALSLDIFVTFTTF